MMATTLRSDPLTDLEWLRSFAARLAGEEADDLVQQTWLATLDRRAEPASSRPWLATVMRNRLRMQWRSATARRRREAEMGEGEPALAPDVSAHRLAVLRVLVERLEALPETDRQIVVARYFDGRDATQIGTALGLEPSTVRSRLRRALQRLRGELDEHFGGERVTWAGLVAIPVPGPGAAPAGPLVFSSSAKVGAILAVLGVVATAVWLSVRPSAAPEPTTRPVTLEASARAEEPGPGPSSGKLAWQRRGTEIRRAQHVARADAPADEVPTDAVPTEEAPRIQELVGAAHHAQSQAVLDCGEARGRAIEGALVLRTSVLGAPDVGTIYESVEIVGDTESSREFVDCIEAAMYDWVGPAPAAPFETTTTVTHLGRNPQDQDKEVWRRRMFDSVVQAHLSEVRACEEADDSEGAATGVVTLSMSFGTEPFATEVVLDSSTASDAVTTCVLDAARVWGFPRPVLEDHTFSRQFVLPIDPMVDGEATDRSVE